MSTSTIAANGRTIPRLPRGWSREQLDATLDAVDTTRGKALVLVAFDTGLSDDVLDELDLPRVHEDGKVTHEGQDHPLSATTRLAVAAAVHERALKMVDELGLEALNQYGWEVRICDGDGYVTATSTPRTLREAVDLMEEFYTGDWGGFSLVRAKDGGAE